MYLENFKLFFQKNAGMEACPKFFRKLQASSLKSLYLNQVEELVLERNKLSCYELIAKFIECISDHLEDLTKQRYASLHMH